MNWCNELVQCECDVRSVLNAQLSQRAGDASAQGCGEREAAETSLESVQSLAIGLRRDGTGRELSVTLPDEEPQGIVAVAERAACRVCHSLDESIFRSDELIRHDALHLLRWS